VTPKGRPHPSGRPIHHPKVGVRSIWRIPDMESNVPRLRPQGGTVEAIGFVHDFGDEENNSD
jgi:hypothetical protein